MRLTVQRLIFRYSKKVETKVPAVIDLGVFGLVINMSRQLNVFKRHAFIGYGQYNFIQKAEAHLLYNNTCPFTSINVHFLK